MNWLKQQVANVAGTAEPIYGPSALRSVAVQAEKTPFTELTKDDLKWKAMDSTCVETQTFYLFAESGHIGLAQVIYSNVAGIRTACQFNSKIHYPAAAHKPHLWCSDPLDDHGFSADRTCFFADGCAMDLSAAGTFYTVKSARNEKSLVDLKITRAAPGFQVGENGTSYFGTDPQEPWGSMRHVFWPRCEVTGGFETKEGRVEFQRAMFVHALQGMKPHHAAARWNFVNFQSPTYSAVMMEFTTPPSYGSSVVNVSAIATDGAIVCAGAKGAVTHASTNDDPDWPEPKAAKFEWHGTDDKGAKVDAEIAGDLGPRVDKVDVMAEVPGFVKTIVGGVVGTRPFIYQFYPQPGPKLKLNVGGKESTEQGKLFMESTFISE